MAGLHVKKGDKVIVVTGKDKGKQGEVITVMPKNRRVRVSGVNMAKRHTKPTMGNPGGIVEKELAIDVSNVALVDPKTGEATRVGTKVLENGKKVRFAKKSGEVIDN